MNAAITAMLTLAIGLMASTSSYAAGVPPGTAGMRAVFPATGPIRLAQHERDVVRKPVRAAPRRATVRRVFVEPPEPVERPWMRPFFPTVGGVTLGAIKSAHEAGLPAAWAAAHGICWYWADPRFTRGFWDYCRGF